MTKQKILVLGSHGMAGHMIYHYLRSFECYTIFNSSYPQALNEESLILDVYETEKLNQLILEKRPDILINCIGLLIKDSSRFPEKAVYVNSYLPHLLKRFAIENHIRIIHLSTDCVFSGKKGEYSEDETPDAPDIYGKSKSLGELINDVDLTFRTSIIGPELSLKGEGLLNWVLCQHGDINGYTNVKWTGITTLELARAIHAAITQNLTGLYHLVPNHPISKYHLLQQIKETFHIKDLDIHEHESKPTDKSLINNRNDFNYKVKDYHTMLVELSDYMIENQEIYFHYKNAITNEQI